MNALWTLRPRQGHFLNSPLVYLWFLITLLLLWPHSALSKESSPMWTRQAHSEAQLIYEHDTLSPGHTTRVGLLIHLDPGWHTYWVNPGDSGAPAIFEFDLPPGVEVSEIQFPTPKRIPTGPLMTFGYEDQLILYAELSLPQNYTESSFPLRFEAEWLVCEDICIPAVHSFATQLPVAPEAQVSKWQPHFEVAQSLLPQTKTTEWTATFEVSGSDYIIEVKHSDLDFEFIDWLPLPESIMANSPPTLVQDSPLRFSLQKSRLDHPVDREHPTGLFIYKDPSQQQVQSVILKTQKSDSPLLYILVLAFLGGLILNLMPCVFPIISMKFFAVVQSAHSQPLQVRLGNLAYCLGVLVSFWALALILVFLRSGGELLGWGFQLQSPTFVALLCLLFVALAFNFLGFFDFQIRTPKATSSLTANKGFGSHFFTGVLSTIVASPCTAPFMGASIGFALTQTTWTLLFIFSFLGLGLAFPYLLLAIFPQLVRNLPRPGPWMLRLKEFMAFPMLATSIWLLWVLSLQVDATTLALVLTSLLLLGMAVWVHKQCFSQSPPTRLAISATLTLAAMALSVSSTWTTTSPAREGVNTSNHQAYEWIPFSPQTVESLQQSDHFVFVDFTAAWCITCQVNKRVTLQNSDVVEFVNEHNLKMLVADWTNKDPMITATLQQYGRAGVPFYLVYSPHSSIQNPLILPEILTPQIFIHQISQYMNQNQQGGPQ